jgi:hypothetical protein
MLRSLGHSIQPFVQAFLASFHSQLPSVGLLSYGSLRYCVSLQLAQQRDCSSQHDTILHQFKCSTSACICRCIRALQRGTPRVLPLVLGMERHMVHDLVDLLRLPMVHGMLKRALMVHGLLKHAPMAHGLLKYAPMAHGPQLFTKSFNVGCRICWEHSLTCCIRAC